MKALKFFISLLILLSIPYRASSQKRLGSKMTDGDLKLYANQLAHKFIITDGHVDLP